MARTEDELAKAIQETYAQAKKEVKEKLDDFIAKHKAKDARMKKQVEEGKISAADYKDWQKGQLFAKKQWKQKLKDVTRIYTTADEHAREIISSKRIDAFADAANHVAYEIERDHGFNGAVSFNLYDTRTVEKLLKDDPQMLPEWKINEPKDYVWNYKRVKNAVTQGIIQGESVGQIGKRLSEELSTSNARKMDMFARTAVTGAQNAGRIERMRESRDMGIDVKKKWLATLDARTRDTHQALDGQEQDVDKPFEVGGMSIDYPGDSRAPAELVYNCRCTLTYVYPKYKSMQDAGKRRDQETGAVIPNTTYKQWKAMKNGKQNQQGKNAGAESLASNVKAIVDNVMKHTGTWALDELKQNGRHFANEIDRRYASSSKLIEDQISAMKQEEYRLSDEFDRLHEQILEEYRKDQPDEKMLKQLAKKRDTIAGRMDDLREKRWQMSRGSRYNSVVDEILQEIRSCGGVNEQNAHDFFADDMNTYQKKKATNGIINALNRYPTEWLEHSKNSGITLKPHWTNGRAYYSPRNGEIRVNERESTNVHELGHRFEKTVPGILKAEADFYESRTKGEDLAWLGPGYRRDEKTRKDDFISPYMGKEYKDYSGEYYAFELVSMGFQYALTDYGTLKKDEDMRDWILGILSSM